MPSLTRALRVLCRPVTIMAGNILDEWAEQETEIEASEIVESDLSLSKIRHKVESKSRRAKISIAYRLAAYSAAKEPDNQNTDSQLDTVITRLVKLNRLVKKQRNYTEVKG